MTFEEFKAKLIAKFGEDNVSFRETGKDGWSRIEDVDPLKMSHGNKGPHWCDAEPCVKNPHYGGLFNSKLLGTYSFNSSTATFFVDVSVPEASV